MSNQTAKIVRFHETGGPEVLKLEKEPLPEPEKGEVRLRVHAIGLNRAEVMFRLGRYLVEPRFPSKNGYEASGVVEAVGQGVDQGMIGKKFSSIPCFDLGKYGVYGEVAILPAYALASFPETLSFAEATSIWMQYMTAYGALVHYGKLAKGDFVLITAASSSVGIAAIEIARAEGAISIATTRTHKKKAELLKLGADHVIVTDEEDLPTRVKEITQGKGARIIFDPIAGKSIEKLADAAAEKGIIFVYGNLSNEPMPYPLFSALAKGLSIRGYTLFELSTVPELREKAQKYIFDHIKDGTFKPKIARTFQLEQIVEAHRFMESNEQIGKIVVALQ
ncbi:zinc-dependent alcohol dehydrogenase family protein [Legionella micdadei]|uniref:NADPH:quinone reductase n=1 Tax=Legionella micdadei TaxID=451 RepID=A0A098GCM7_LEGMI|nr:zinc-dependent alcohol dehydrogenase family protein [Legionella micdadei]ARG98130.1 NADPH:quinone reductase [Legionella micdadei]KTD30026.1 quinone oxidoreductase [Legionella micdadei]NSL18595.1 zinc-dependent alcohol dehydrogenase family protein [Legionella micdadei]CEG60218.1 putative quinone oxidoreductase [Legionella micdadei]SCY58464.1 NADPH:quinone reductase [Legionella micdadei]